jgi:hypothetical protein
MPSQPPPPPYAARGEVPSQPPEGHRLARFGALVGAGTLAAFAAAVPAALRIASAPDAPDGLFRAWSAVAGALVVPAIGATAALRGARNGLGAFAGQGWQERVAALALWATSAFALLAAFGAFLRATTHHRPLAGVTFGLVGAALLAVLTLVVVRLHAMGRAHLVVRVAIPFVAATLAALEAFVVLRVARPFAAGFFVDFLALLVPLVIASHPSHARRRALALFGPPLGAIALALGIAALRTTPALVPACAQLAPIFAPFIAFLGGAAA